MIVAFAIPPPSHIVCSPYRPPVCSSVVTSVVSSRAPEAPRGWPRAIAPPRELSRAGSAARSASQASGTGANASFTSYASMSSMVSPARSRTLRVAGMMPVSMRIGSSPVTENEWNRARGRSESRDAMRSLMIRTAAAPSVSGEELPGVISQLISSNRSPAGSP